MSDAIDARLMSSCASALRVALQAQLLGDWPSESAAAALRTAWSEISMQPDAGDRFMALLRAAWPTLPELADIPAFDAEIAHNRVLALCAEVLDAPAARETRGRLREAFAAMASEIGCHEDGWMDERSPQYESLRSATTLFVQQLRADGAAPERTLAILKGELQSVGTAIGGSRRATLVGHVVQEFVEAYYR